jgi:hypothetical protein
MSRLAQPTAINLHQAVRGFSNFDFVDTHFAGCVTIRRLFSLARARCRNFSTVVVEDVPPAGAVADENTELLRLYSDYRCEAIKRISFWRIPITNTDELRAADADACLGWAIVKHDHATLPMRRASPGIPARVASLYDDWHVFESVTVKYAHEHNYVPGAPMFSVQIGDRASLVRLRGWLYCQQNTLNKSCAQVALRTLATAFLNDPELPYSRLNSLRPSDPTQPNWLPGDGLRPRAIEAILNALGIPFDSLYYPDRPEKEDARRTRAYQRYLYAGVEAGTGSLLGFNLDGPGASDSCHIIPVFGHTFNEDTWAPRGEGAYFRVGETIRYIPSEAWVSSFLIHDDNYGSDFCLPKRFVRRRSVNYVVALRPAGFASSCLDAEAVGSHLFYSLLPRLIAISHPWLRRLLTFVSRHELILRTAPITREEYEAELRAMSDWSGEVEESGTVDSLRSLLRDHMWIVEVSVPDLFSTNLRKLGELLLLADAPLDQTAPHRSFLFARFPRHYLLPSGGGTDDRQPFSVLPSALDSHTKLFRA